MAELDELRTKVEGYRELQAKVTLLEKALAYGGPSLREAPRMKIPEPKSFSKGCEGS